MGDDRLIVDLADDARIDADDATDGDSVSMADETEPNGTDKAKRDHIPEELPILPLRDSVVFPGTIMPLKLMSSRVRRVVDAALAGPRMLCTVAQRRSDVEEPKLPDLHRVGTACTILKLSRMEDGSETIIIQGMSRVGIVELVQESPFLVAITQARPDSVDPSTELEALVLSVRTSARRAIELSPHVPEEALDALEGIPTASGLADFLAANLALPLVNKQELLETFDVQDRLHKVNQAVVHQIEILEVSEQIQNKVRSQVDRSQREYYLREELKAIQQELGVSDARSAEVEKYRRRIAKANMPELVEQEALHELERLASIPQSSPEYSNAADYLDWLSSLPWSVSTEDRLDIKGAARILDQDHYGLQKVKKRVLEFLAVRKLKPDGRGPILCFTGPPGVGKTSLGQSIARALDRKFVRISLGGARDEADIRGHRRTYIGALPGRIIQELRKVGANNPVFMLDEVDKLGKDFRGDPASALLEVLDPEQNFSFSDRYLDVPFDLSGVLFIATANYIDAIPSPLRDRMEVIELSGYTRREKLQIAIRYLVPRQLNENGLDNKVLRFDKDALRTIISDYTLEAGVRELERKIGAVCRARAAAIVEGTRRAGRVTVRSLTKYLGHPLHETEMAADRAVPGVVTGLAYTPAGGDILFVEATLMPGKGNLNLTGQIGDVMRESAQAAFSIVKSRSARMGIDRKVWFDNDFHIHVPSGAIPKDGPSAGVAMFTALTSLLTDRTVDPATGMTGEITLRGAILPVGGIREKVLAAHRARLTRVVLPHRNLRDLDELPADVRKDIDFVPVKRIEQLLAAVFTAPRKRTTPTRPKRKTSTQKPKRAKAKKTASTRRKSPKSTAKAKRRTVRKR